MIGICLLACVHAADQPGIRNQDKARHDQDQDQASGKKKKNKETALRLRTGVWNVLFSSHAACIRSSAISGNYLFRRAQGAGRCMIQYAEYSNSEFSNETREMCAINGSNQWQSETIIMFQASDRILHVDIGSGDGHIGIGHVKCMSANREEVV